MEQHYNADWIQIDPQIRFKTRRLIDFRINQSEVSFWKKRQLLFSNVEETRLWMYNACEQVQKISIINFENRIILIRFFFFESKLSSKWFTSHPQLSTSINYRIDDFEISVSCCPRSGKRSIIIIVIILNNMMVKCNSNGTFVEWRCRKSSKRLFALNVNVNWWGSPPKISIHRKTKIWRTENDTILDQFWNKFESSGGCFFARHEWIRNWKRSIV